MLKFLCVLIVTALYFTPVHAQIVKLPAMLQFNHNEGMYGYHDGQLYLFGGKALNGLQDSCWTLDLASPLSWQGISRMPTSRLGGAVHFYEGKFYLIGGLVEFIFGSGPTKYIFAEDVLSYDPETHAYTVVSKMPRNEYGAATVLVGPKVYLLGGFNETTDSLAEREPVLQIYDIATNTWTMGSNVPFASDYPGATAIGNTIYYLGNRNKDEAWGFRGTIVDSGIVWEALPAPPVRTFAHAVGSVNGKPYFAAGAIDESGGPPNQAIYFLKGGSWQKEADFPSEFDMGLFSAVMPTDGENLYYIGGTGNQFTYKITPTSAGVGTANDMKVVHVSPNPAITEAIFTVSDEAIPGSLEIYDILGRIVGKFSLHQRESRIPVTHLEPGVYHYCILGSIHNSGSFICK